MTISFMIYGMMVALLLGGAAHFLDRGLRSLGKPTRWVWITAMAGGAVAPILPRLVPTSPPQPLARTMGVSMETLYEVAAFATAGTMGSTPSFFTAEGSLVTLWIFGSLFVLTVFGGVCLRLRLERKKWKTGQVKGEEVLLSKGLGPAVLGLVRPRIVLPPWALTLAEDQLELVVLHEREHREARDPGLLGAGLFLAALSPWNPVLWWALQRLRLAVEGDCDARVLARGVSPNRYGRLLLHVASRGRGLPAMTPALTEGGTTYLEKRLHMIRLFVGKHSVGAGLSAAAVGTALLVLACETPMPPETPDVDAVVQSLTALPGQPLYYVDGVRMSDPDVIESLDKEQIDRIEVIKGSAARTLYGEEAANGVIKVFLKGTDEPPDAPRDRSEFGREPSGDGDIGQFRIRGADGSDATGKEPLIYVDGVLMPGDTEADPKESLAAIHPDDIGRIEVIKGSDAVARYGEEAANGVILIFTKKK